MSIYMDLLNATKEGRRFKVDLTNKSLWIDRKPIIEKGVVLINANNLIEPRDSAWFCSEQEKPFNEHPWDWVEGLYHMYKHSVPGGHSNCKVYFKALPVDELSDVELAYNPERDFMQAALEGYILLASLQGWLQWQNETHWFWQCQNDKELVVLKDWIWR